MFTSDSTSTVEVKRIHSVQYQIYNKQHIYAAYYIYMYVYIYI